MNDHRIVGVLRACCVLLLSVGLVHAKPINPYHGGDWQGMMAQTKGRAAIIHIWGFSCGPCLAELPDWGRFVQSHPKLKTAFLEVDQVPEALTVKTLTQAQLIDADNYVATDYFDEYLRYEIDSKWQGELPITLLIDSSGKIKKIRGSVDFKLIDEWANKNAQPD